MGSDPDAQPAVRPEAEGQPLFEAYCPELVSVQREYAIAMQRLEVMKEAGTEAQAGMRQLADSSLARLRNWDLSAPQVAALMKSGQPQRMDSWAASSTSTLKAETRSIAVCVELANPGQVFDRRCSPKWNRVSAARLRCWGAAPAVPESRKSR